MIHPNPDDLGMALVTREQFYAYVGPRHITISPEGYSKGPYGIWASFKCLDQGEVGRIYTNKLDFEDKAFLLRKDLAQ